MSLFALGLVAGFAVGAACVVCLAVVIGRRDRGLRGMAMRGRHSPPATARAWLLVAFCVSVLFILAIVLDWLNLLPLAYELTGSIGPFSKKTAGH